MFVTRLNRKRLRTSSSSSSSDDSCNDDSNDDFLAGVDTSDDEKVDLSSNLQSSDDISIENEDIPLSVRLDKLQKNLLFIETSNFTPKVHPFTDNNSGLQRDCGLDANSSCIDIFKAFISEDIADMIACQSNIYKENKKDDMRKSNKLKQNSRLNKCNDITSDEFYTFLAVQIMMGIVKKPSIEMYWSKDPIIETPFFAKTTTLVRFQTITSLLHFSEDTYSSDKLGKIRPFIDHLVGRFQSIYRPGNKISIDESLMKWTGSLSFKQFQRNKRARFGLKFYETCDSENGYIYNYKIYVGKDKENTVDKSLLGSSGEVVLELLGDLVGQGRTLYIDSWYTSPKLFAKLHQEKVNACGTVRSNRMHIPKIDYKKLKKGEMKVFSSPIMTCISWKDKKIVNMLSTIHSPKMITTNKIDYRSKENKQKPNIVIDYNNNMGGVDLSDQCTSSYEIIRKSKKWYIKTFFHLIDMAIFNSFVVYKILHNDSKITVLDFRKQLVRDLVKYHCKHNSQSNPRFSNENPTRFAEPHFPALIRENKSERKRCILCYRNKKTKLVHYKCENCNDVPLCVIPCFKIYHTREHME